MFKLLKKGLGWATAGYIFKQFSGPSDDGAPSSSAPAAQEKPKGWAETFADIKNTITSIINFFKDLVDVLDGKMNIAQFLGKQFLGIGAGAVNPAPAAAPAPNATGTAPAAAPTATSSTPTVQQTIAPETVQTIRNTVETPVAAPGTTVKTADFASENPVTTALGLGAAATVAAMGIPKIKAEILPALPAPSPTTPSGVPKIAAPEASAAHTGAAVAKVVQESEKGILSKTIGKRGGLAATAVVGAGTFAADVYAGKAAAQAATDTVTTVVPFADAAVKAYSGDTAGAAKSATVDGVSLAGMIAGAGTGAGLGATWGAAAGTFILPGAGTAALGAVGGVAGGIVGSITGSGVAGMVTDFAWDTLGLSSYFNNNATGAAPATPAPSRPAPRPEPALEWNLTPTM